MSDPGNEHAAAGAEATSGLDYAVFTELSPESKLLKGGWNTRVFTNTDSRKGEAIQCDFATGTRRLSHDRHVHRRL